MRRLSSHWGNILMIGMIAIIVVSVLAIILSTVSDRTSHGGYEDAVGESVATTSVTDGDAIPLDGEGDGELICRFTPRSSSGTIKEQLDIFIKTDVGYCNVNFTHNVYKTGNYDIWRLNKMVAVDDKLTKRYDITNTGEFEAALRLQGRSDFAGGSQHGDEMLSAVEFYIDGERIDIADVKSYRACSEMKIVRDSLFYDPADHTTQIATHRVEYIINKDGVRIQQSVIWSVDAVCDTSYLAMFPVLRTTTDASGKAVAVSKQYTDDKTATVYDVSVAGKTEYPQTFKPGVRKITLTSDELGLTSSLELVDITNIPGAGYSDCSRAEQYNKLYYTITGYAEGDDYKVKSGDTWNATTHYAVSITK